MFGKIKLSALALAVSLPLSAAGNSVGYMDKDLRPALRNQAEFQHAPFKANEDGVVPVQIYYKNSEQLYLTTLGYFDAQGALVYDGEFEFFKPDGLSLEKGTFKQGKRDGLVIKPGKYQGVEHHDTYQDGLIIEKKEIYDGEVERRETFEYDPENSKTYTWRCFVGDHTTCVSRYVNGLQEGLQESNDSRNKLRKEFNYVAGQPHGLQKIYINDNLYITQNYKNGQRDGVSKEYSTDGTGSLLAERNFVNGKQFGETIIYYPDGGIKKKVQFGFDEQAISHDRYYQNGRLLETMRSDEKLNQTITRYGIEGEVIFINHLPKAETEWGEKLIFGEGGYLNERYRSVAATEQRHMKQYHSNGLLSREYTIAEDRSKHDRRWNQSGVLTSELFEPADRKEWVKHYTYYESGQIEKESLTLRSSVASKNEKVAIINRYDNNGVLIAREQRLDFKRNGEQIKSSAKQNYVEFTYYQNDKPNGPYKKRTFDGEFIAAGQYIEGEKNGVWQEMGFENLPIPNVFPVRESYPIEHNGESSRLISEYRNGKLHGKYKFLDSKGVALIDGLFNQGKPVGNWLIKPSAKAQPLIKKNYKDNRPHGDWIETDFYHAVTFIGHFEQGKRVGEWVGQKSGGKTVIKGQFKQGLPNGEWQTYAEDGQLLCRMMYQQGKPQGEWTQYTKEGEVKWQRVIKEGELSIDTNHADSVGNHWQRQNQADIPNDCYINIENYFTLDH